MKKVIIIVTIVLMFCGVAVAGVAWLTYPLRHGAQWDSNQSVWQYRSVPVSSLKIPYGLSDVTEYRDGLGRFSFRYPKEWKSERRADDKDVRFFVERKRLWWSPERWPIFDFWVDNQAEVQYLTTSMKGSQGRYSASEQLEVQFYGGLPWLVYDLPSSESRLSGYYPYPRGVLEFGDWRIIVNHFRPEIFKTFRYTGLPLTSSEPTVKLAFTFKPYGDSTGLVADSYSFYKKSALVVRRDGGLEVRPIYSPKMGSTTLDNLVWSPDRKYLIFSESKNGDNKKIYLADLLQGKGYLVRVLSNNHSSSLVWSPKGDQIALAEIQEIDSRKGLYFGKLHVINLPAEISPTSLSSITIPYVDTLPGVVQWTGDDIYYVGDGKLMRLNPNEPSIAPAVDITKKAVTAFAVSGVSQKLVYALNTGELYFRDLSQPNSSDQLVKDFVTDDGIDYIEELEFSSDGEEVRGYYPLGNNFVYNIATKKFEHGPAE